MRWAIELADTAVVMLSGSLPIALPAGRYLYCGSAKGPGGLKARLSRHMRRGKSVRWHVDQLTEQGLVIGSWIFPGGDIEKYLSSGMIRGVGPVYAKKLVRAFGEKVFDVIEATPEVDGIGPVRAASILAAWAEQKAVREIMVFLHSHGVGTARAVRIFKTYGSDAIQVMTENPYRLARDIRGIGFKTADAIAMKLGIEKTAMVRVRAGISYALTEAMDEGH
jgi:Uri superfamily endonuclease